MTDAVTFADGSYLDWSVVGEDGSRQLEVGNADGDAVIVDMDADGFEQWLSVEPVAAAYYNDAGEGYDDSKHPHAPAGSSTGGQFTSTNTRTSSGPKPRGKPRGKLTYSGKKQSYRTTRGGKPKRLLKRTTVLRLGADNDPEAVTQLQHLVNELGLAGINADGQFGPSTEAAVKAVQTKLGMDATGRATQALVRRLRDAHTLSPCVDRSATQVTASAFYPELDDEIEPVLAAAGKDVTPGHDELHHYWTRGEGLARWVGSPTPWTTLVALLSEHVPLNKAKTFASRWFIEVFGFAAGSDKNRVAHGHPPRGKLVGPG